MSSAPGSVDRSASAGPRPIVHESSKETKHALNVILMVLMLSLLLEM